MTPAGGLFRVRTPLRAFCRAVRGPSAACKTHARRAAARAERDRLPGVRSDRTNQGTKPGRRRAGGLGVHGCSAPTDDSQRGGPGERLVRGIVRWDRTAAVRGPLTVAKVRSMVARNRACYHPQALYNEHSVGAWRTLVARIVRDHEVGGSNPLAPTKYQLIVEPGSDAASLHCPRRQPIIYRIRT